MGFASEALSVLESRVTKEFVKQTRTLLRVKGGSAVISDGQKLASTWTIQANLER